MPSSVAVGATRPASLPDSTARAMPEVWKAAIAGGAPGRTFSESSNIAVGPPAMAKAEPDPSEATPVTSGTQLARPSLARRDRPFLNAKA